MKAAELRGRDPGELRRELAQLQRELFELRFRWQSEESPDSSSRRRIKKDIARYRTVLCEIEREQQTPAPGGR